MEIKIERINKRNVIRLSNSLNTIKHNLSAVALDILYSLFANVRKEDEEFFVYEITINELNERLGRKINKDSLKNALKELYEDELYFILNPQMKFKFLEICEYEVSNSFLKIKLNVILNEFLLNLEKEFFKINFDSFLKLKSKYSKILYSILCQYKNIKKIKIDVEDLKNLLYSTKSFEKYGNFKQRVLNPTLTALKELDEFDYIAFREYKRVKNINKIEFILIQDEYLKKKEIEKLNKAKLKENNKSNGNSYKTNNNYNTKKETIDVLELWLVQNENL